MSRQCRILPANAELGNPQSTGKWCKSIRGKLQYFGNWGRRENGKLVRIPGDGWEQALDEYKRQADDLHSGRKPRESGDELLIADLCNSFLIHCDEKVSIGEMVRRTSDGYKATMDRIVRVLGKTRVVKDLHPDGFATLRRDIAKTRGPVAAGNEITCCRVVFNFAVKNLLIKQPVSYGLSFQRLTKKTLRKEQAKNGKNMFTAEECRRIIAAAYSPELKAMMLLDVNCGFKNSDCAKLPVDAM